VALTAQPTRPSPGPNGAARFSEIGKACRPLGFSPTYEVAAREAEARIPFGLPRSDGEHQDEVVVRPFTPVEGVLRTVR
jgi:hypothetical protein